MVCTAARHDETLQLVAGGGGAHIGEIARPSIDKGGARGTHACK